MALGEARPPLLGVLDIVSGDNVLSSVSVVQS